MFERFLWGLAGLASTGFGLLGLIVPILPGFLFLLLAAVCFSRAAKPAPPKSQRRRREGAPGLAQELRRDMHRQYRSVARQVANQQRRFRHR